jgi:hypothetical protein
LLLGLSLSVLSLPVNLLQLLVLKSHTWLSSSTLTYLFILGVGVPATRSKQKESMITQLIHNHFLVGPVKKDSCSSSEIKERDNYRISNLIPHDLAVLILLLYHSLVNLLVVNL